MLGRKGCPLTIKSANGRTIFEEGRDFEPVVDPQLGNVPWPGEMSSAIPARDPDQERLADQGRRSAARELVSSGDHAWLAGHVLPERAEG